MVTMLLALRLQQAGIDFISAKAVHRPSGTAEAEIVCPTVEAAQVAALWASNEKLPATIRVATPEELEEHRRLQELT
jgi:hypothetical protein